MKKITQFAILISILSFLSCRIACATADLPTVESFFNDPNIRQVVISPQGHYVAMLNKKPGGGQILVVCDTLNLKNVSVAAATKDDDIIAIHWVNENRISFTVQSMGHEFESSLDEFATDRDGKNTSHLISGAWKHYLENASGGIVSAKLLTADYAYAGSLHDGSDDIIVAKYLFNHIDYYAQSSHLFRLNTRTLTLSQLQEGNTPGNVFSWLLDADGVPRIAVSQLKGICSTHYLAPGSTDWVEINSGDCFSGAIFHPRFLDGSDTLFVTAPYKGYDALYKYDLKKKQLAAEPFMAIDGFDFSGSPEVDRNVKKVMGIHFRSDAQSTVWIEPQFKQMQAKIDSILPQTNNRISCGDDCLTAPAVLVTANSDRQPNRYFIYVPATGAITSLGSSRADIKAAQMGQRDFYHYAARDGLSIPVYVTLPPGKPTGPMPTVVLVHGGPNLRGGSWEWESDAQFLASRGYVVIQPEYRGSTGFGFAHFKAGWKQWGGTMQDDLADAAKWSIQKGWSDPKRIAIMGGSYGGYATLEGLIKNPEIFRCGVDWSGVTDLALRYNLPYSDATEEVLNYTLKTLMGDPVTDAVMFKANSPLQHAEQLKQPLLLAHGVQDRRVPIVHATDFRNAVTKTNSHVEWISYLNEAHGWRHEEDAVDFWKHVEVFLDKNLKAVE